jgi:hypothetical protein
LIFEALVPLTLKTKTKGILELQSGERMDVPPKVILQLQEQIPDKIRVIGDERNQLHSGVWVEFFSPLWGMCTARIQAVTVDGCIITNHAVLKGEGEPVTIPASWICGVYREQQAS